MINKLPILNKEIFKSMSGASEAEKRRHSSALERLCSQDCLFIYGAFAYRLNKQVKNPPPRKLADKKVFQQFVSYLDEKVHRHFPTVSALRFGRTNED